MGSHLLAAYDLSTDRLYGHVRQRRAVPSSSLFCRYIRSLHPAEVRIAIVLDNFSPHLSTKTEHDIPSTPDVGLARLVDDAHTGSYSCGRTR
jgi:hypothetical protein